MVDKTNPDILSDGLERVSEAAKFLDVSRSQIYKLINLGVLPSVKIGSIRRLPVRAVRDLAKNGLNFGGCSSE